MVVIASATMVTRLALLLVILVAACGGPTRYGLVVDSPAVPFKPVDPDDLVEDADEDDDADDGAKPSKAAPKSGTN